MWSVFNISLKAWIVKAVYHNISRFVEKVEKNVRQLYNSHKEVVAVNRVRELRLSKSMRQADLAKLLNVQPTAVSNYELGLREMDAPTIHALCDIFGCTADYLLGRSPVASPELNPEEEDLLLAWRAAPPEIRAIIDTALAPYREDADDPGAAAPTA